MYGTAFEQALRGALAAGREKEGELATTSQELTTPENTITYHNTVKGWNPGVISKVG